MGKLLALCALLALLCGCSPKAPAKPDSPLAGHSGNYETTANITYRELAATATIHQQAPDSCQLTFTSPESLRDMSFVFYRDSVDVSYKGLGFQFNPSAMPGGAVAKLAVNAINKSMQDDGVQLSLTDSGMEISGMMETGQFILRLDPDQGNLLKLSVPTEELEIEFANFRFLD